MKTIIERNALLKALNHVQSVVERRNTIPILSNVLLEADKNLLSLTATDLEIEIREQVEADISAAGAVTAPAHMLYDIVRKLPDGAQVELSVDDGQSRLTLVSGRSSFALQALPREDFPSMPKDDMPVTFALSSSELRRLIDKTRFAISTEETRYYLNGIYLHVLDDENPMLRAVATDGHRLARVQMPRPTGADKMPAIIVPRKTVSEVQKLLEEEEGEVALQVSDTRINFAFADIVLTSKLIDGKFPDYTRVIPTENDKTLSVDAKSLSQSVDRVAAISSEKSRAVKLSLEGDKLGLSVSNPESGNASDELSVSYGADALEIGFNARYLLEIAAQLDGEQAMFKLSDAGSPTLVLDDEDDNALYVLMPMRV
ncbi:MAG: DNA polymerase III subunit beta [Parvibaculales bacterium]